MRGCDLCDMLTYSYFLVIISISRAARHCVPHLKQHFVFVSCQIVSITTALSGRHGDGYQPSATDGKVGLEHLLLVFWHNVAAFLGVVWTRPLQRQSSGRFNLMFLLTPWDFLGVYL